MMGDVISVARLQLFTAVVSATFGKGDEGVLMITTQGIIEGPEANVRHIHLIVVVMKVCQKQQEGLLQLHQQQKEG